MDEVDTLQHSDPLSELSVELIKKKAVKGIVTLTGRTFFLQILSLGATFLLTVFLTPSQFGIFFVVSAVTNFFAYFSDIGLAAALIQKKDNPSSNELKTAFTVQNTLIVFLVIVIFLVTPIFRSWYHLDQAAIYLLWALAFSLFLSSLKTIPSVLMERKLDFERLVFPQIVEAVFYQGIVVFLAWKGFGITSFTIAVVVRGIVGLFMTYLMQPWVPGLQMKVDDLKSLLRFGLPYQINAFLAVAKDDGMTAILGVILGPANMGLLGWAQKWGTAPLRFFMDQVIRVTFPAFSRLQTYPEELQRAVTRSIFFISALVFPSLVGLSLLAPWLVILIPRYSKWEMAVLALGLISINSAWAAISTPLTNLLNAIGKINITFKLMIMWTVLTWLLLPVLSYLYGVNGAAVGYTLVGSSSIVAIVIANKFVKVDFWVSVGKPLVSTVIMSLLVLILKIFLPISWVSIITLITVGASTFLLSIYFLAGPSLTEDFKKVLSNLRNRQ